MKNFFSTFAAVLAAIIVAAVGYGVLDSMRQWDARRDALLEKLHSAERRVSEDVETRNRFQNDETTLDALKSGENFHEAEVIDRKTALVKFYPSKMFPLSASEKLQVSLWKNDIARYTADHSTSR